jgi:hypothetical protein
MVEFGGESVNQTGEVPELVDWGRLLSGCRGKNLYPGFESLPPRLKALIVDVGVFVCIDIVSKVILLTPTCHKSMISYKGWLQESWL